MGDIKLRLHLNNEHEVDWIVPPPYDITFQDVLDIIEQASDYKVQVGAFEYEDEDGDLTTVRSDTELHAMLHYFIHISNLSSASPLSVFPKIRDPAARTRNRFALKVSIKPSLSSVLMSSSSSIPPHYNELGDGPPSRPTTTQVSKFIPHHDDDDDDGGGSAGAGESSMGSATPSPSSSASLGSQPTYNGDTLLMLEVLGRGNSGVVRKARHKPTGSVSAVKSITLDLTGEEQRRILLELEILQRCSGSPYIIGFFGAYFEENRVMLCTEYMDGGSLDRYGAIPQQVLKNVASSISHGLRELWRLRIMHRDVKPSNILVNTLGHIKLCDFGVSTLLVDSIARTYVGTNAYMAPERVVGREYTVYSDVWSFGLSLLELSRGQFPYQQLAPKIAGSRGVLPIELMQCIVNEPPPRLQHGPPDLTDFISRCLQTEAERRPLPEQLCRHQLVTTNMRNSPAFNLDVVAKWIKSRL